MSWSCVMMMSQMMSYYSCTVMKTFNRRGKKLQILKKIEKNLLKKQNKTKGITLTFHYSFVFSHLVFSIKKYKAEYRRQQTLDSKILNLDYK